METVERPVDPPPTVAGPNRGGIGKISWKIPPLATGTHQVKNGVDYLAPVHRSWAPGRLRGKKRGDTGPLLVGQVGRITASHSRANRREKAKDRRMTPKFRFGSLL